MKGICENPHNTLFCCPLPYVDGWCARCASDRIDKLARRLTALCLAMQLEVIPSFRALQVVDRMNEELLMHLERDDV